MIRRIALALCLAGCSAPTPLPVPPPVAPPADLEARGLLRSFTTCESQYTAINYTVTDAGKAALRKMLT